MNRKHPATAGASDPARTTDEDAGIEELLREVGARTEPSAELTGAVRAAVHAEWRAVVQQRASRRRRAGLALAAGVVGLVAATAVLRLHVPQSQPQWVATLVRVDGRAQIEAAGELREARAGDAVQAGMRLQTGTARVALAVGASERLSLRIDAGSQVRFAAPDTIELQAGALYVDADPAGGSLPLSVQTAAGVVRHLGTQYQVRTVATSVPGVEVSIREGRIEIASRYGTNSAVAGERVAVSTAGSVSRSAVSAHDPSWQWAAQIAPAFDIAGRPLSEFLEWVARETGRELIYDSPAVQRAAAALELGGSIQGLDPDTALAGVITPTRFERVESPQGSLRIALKRN